jgi:hypothetical protein
MLGFQDDDLIDLFNRQECTCIARVARLPPHNGAHCAGDAVVDFEAGHLTAGARSCERFG